MIKQNDVDAGKGVIHLPATVMSMMKTGEFASVAGTPVYIWSLLRLSLRRLDAVRRVLTISSVC